MAENVTGPDEGRSGESPEKRRAGLFDIRMIIGMLIGIYGVVLLITGFFTPDSQIQRSDGININLWAGLGMIVVAAVFAVWTWMRPVVVPADPEEVGTGDQQERPAGH